MMPQMSENEKRNIIIGCLCLVIMLMIVGYGALQTVLNINGTARVTTLWNILITDVDSRSTGSATNVTEPSFDDVTATFKTNLVLPGDQMEYDVTVSNKGNVNAVLNGINIEKSDNPAIIISTRGLTQGTTLAAGESKIFTVTVAYDSAVKKQPENTHSDLTITLNFVQEGSV